MIRRRRGLGFVLSIAVLLALPTPVRGGETSDARHRGVRYLLGVQLPVGGFLNEEFGLTSTGHKLAITAIAAHALVATQPDEEGLAAARRAFEFIRRYEGELIKPRVNGGFDYTPWAAACGLLHLDGMRRRWPGDADAPDPSDLAAIFGEFAKRTQRPCGGWDYRLAAADGRPLTDGSVPFLTATMLDGLRAFGLQEEVRRRAIADLEKSADGEGIFGYSHEGKYAEVKDQLWWEPTEAAGRTLHARTVLARCGRCSPEDLKRAVVKFLEVRESYVAARGRSEHVAPHEIAGYYYYPAHYYAMCALRALLATDPKIEEYALDAAGKLVSALLSEQAADGSFEDAPAGGKAYGTAMVLLTLREHEDLRVRWHRDLKAGLERARAKKRAVVLLFLDDNEASRTEVATFYEDVLAPLVGRVELVKLDRRRHSREALRARVYRGPTLLVLDPRREAPLKEPLKKVIGGRDADDLMKLIEKALAAWSAEGV